MKLTRLKPAVIPSAISSGLAALTLIWLFLGMTDSDIAQRIFGDELGKLPKDAQPTFLAATHVVRWLLAIVVPLFLLLIIFLFAREDGVAQPATASMSSIPSPRLLHQDEALALAQSLIQKAGGTPELCLWGFSLQWATPLYRYIREHGRPNLSVTLFIGGPAAWSLPIDYGSVSKEALRTRRDTAIYEWMGLVQTHRIRELRIYEVPLLANDKGVSVNDDLLLLSAYDYKPLGNGNFAFLPNRVEDRVFLVCEGNSESELHLKHWCKQRTICRRFDSPEVTQRYVAQEAPKPDS